MLSFHIVSLFPDVFERYLSESIIGRAVKNKKIKFSFYNPMDERVGGRIDKRPYGGGPGMVLEAKPFLKAHQRAVGKKKGVKTIFFSPSGTPFTQKKAKEYTKFKHLVFLCGHYEGIDERVAKITGAEKLSIGDFVLTGGELPALIVADSVSREIPGVLGNANSPEDLRISSPKSYTRPSVLRWKGKDYKVPEILVSGNHKEIDTFRENEK